MTARHQRTLARGARLGWPLSRIGRECGVSRQRVQQILVEQGIHDAWREAREHVVLSLLAASATRRVDEWRSSANGTLAIEAAEAIGRGYGIELLPGCPPHVTIGSSRVRIVRPRAAVLVSRWNRQRYYRVSMTVADAWYVAALPDGRVAIYAPSSSPTSRYIIADASIRPRGDGVAPMMWLRGAVVARRAA